MHIPKLKNSRKPIKWWNEECDRDILVGIHKHGFGTWESIQQDPDLYFSRFKYKRNIP
eukprot:UN02967